MTTLFDDEQVRVVVGDCVEVMADLPEASVDAIVTDPPYSLGFMGREWDTHDVNEDAAFGYWLAGFIDGEGCFRVQRHEGGTHQCTFSLKVRRDERGTLELCRRFVGAGTIKEGPGTGNAHPQATWAIQDQEGCQRLVDLLDKYPLRAKKRLDFDAWAEAVSEWTSRPRGNRWMGPADQSRAIALKQRVEGARRYVDPPWSGNHFQDWNRLWAAEALRVLKPGGHLLAFGGTRTYHRLACAIEDAGFEIRDSINWIYGSGFPKSMDVSKAIDKAAGAEREVIGVSSVTGARQGSVIDDGAGYTPGRSFQNAEPVVNNHTIPSTSDALKWDGWGTALKPAHEPIVVARKPLIGTVVANVLEHGTGAINIDGCRVGFADEADEAESKQKNRHADFGSEQGGNAVYGDYSMVERVNYNPPGRWPTNVVLGHSPGCRQIGTADVPSDGHHPAARGQGSSWAGHHGQDDLVERKERTELLVAYQCVDGCPVAELEGASRFFHQVEQNLLGDPGFLYEAKAASAERNAGLGGPERPGGVLDGNADTEGARKIGARPDQPVAPTRNFHPTVKPVDLMRYLVRLVTPPGGTVLDPFLGSGTTLLACIAEQRKGIGIERDPEYAELARERVAQATVQLSMF